jgi:hypothetical protein
VHRCVITCAMLLTIELLPEKLQFRTSVRSLPAAGAWQMP